MQLYLETRFEQLKVSNLYVVSALCCVPGHHPVELHPPIWILHVSGCLCHTDLGPKQPSTCLSLT